MALVRDPRTGQMIEVPDEQVQGARGLARPPINVGRAVGDIALGALSVPGAALADLVGYRATQAVGGQVPTETNPRLSAALQRVSTGAEQFGQANVEAFRGLQTAGQQALGVQPAVTPQPAQRGATGSFAPDVVPTPVATRPVSLRGQPGALGQAAEQRQVQAAEAAGVGTGIGIGRQGGEIFRRAGPGGVPEFFNEAAEGGVPAGGATQSEPTGFRSNTGQSASDYLATLSARDQADTAQRQQQGAEARLGLERSTLQREATQGTGNQRLAARQALRAFEAQQLQATQEAGATERTGLTVAAQQEQARQQAEANVLAAQAQAQGQLGAAQLRGQFGLQEAQTAAQGRIGAAGVTATSPQARLAEERARLLQTQQQLAGQASEAGDIGGTFAALGLQQPRAADVATNALGQPVGTYDARGRFVPYTPEELRAAQQAFAPTPQ